ncbi:MAG: formamidopyrimidine-DNA glycosylase [Candidatus Eisenbacteria bacterium]|uniref:Formamidopyrimidine-DNA glycosylase n=1 Tax=Eiseniibacteriota bacterium TaxID=2212470 RepID=A0A956NBX3_UNCEI|nr:formamidopyrimidine-DNA glycosylase [Candidatus Eisenbacteria bacterium]MCB9465489.1 formamidopyrimidine-DNA glycosylase [Candidatus Eisenbacteria bacterium]
MPELPDVTVYIESLTRVAAGQTLERVRIGNPFLLRTFDPPIDEVEGKTVRAFHRSGKRILWELEGGLWLVVHLMIAGRFRWRERGAPLQKKLAVAAFDFPVGTLLLTEAGTQKRAALHVFADRESALALDRGGAEVLGIALEDFARALRRENHTLKRTLTDPRIFSGIGNAYSDEILHHARLSPILLTSKMTDEEIERLHQSTQDVLRTWIERLRTEVGDGFPEKVTAFHPKMAVHGKFGKPCPDCGAPVQRIQYASNETNYCARCQTGGRVLADRSLSRLLKGDWPRTIEELEG